MRQLRYATEVSIAYEGRIPSSVTPSHEGAILPAPSTQANAPFGFDGTPADPGSWKQPPHLALANWNFDSVESLCAFTKHYGPLWLNEGELVVRTTEVENLQGVLQKAWGKQFDSESREARAWIERSLDIIKVGIGIPKLRLTFSNLWLYICALFQIDYHKNRLGICQNVACTSPYFIKTRRSQTHCSTECRNLVNVQRWRSDPANRKREMAARRKARREKR